MAPRGLWQYIGLCKSHLNLQFGIWAAKMSRDEPPSLRRIQVPPPCDLTLGLVCTAKDQSVTTWTMKADERFSNPAGVVQGGFIAAMADSAMGAASVLWVKGRKVFAANTDLQMSFLKPARVGSTLTCTARVVGGGDRVLFVEAEVWDDSGRNVARGRSTYLLTGRTDTDAKAPVHSGEDL